MSFFRKVTAFVVVNQEKLLVFDHPLAGTQLPAGSVEEGEDVIAAAIREVHEESGLDVVGGDIVATEIEDLEGRAILVREANDGDSRIPRGRIVVVLSRTEEIIEIREEIFDYGCTPPRLIEYTELTTATSNVAFKIERSFVKFTTEQDTSRRWPHEADGHTFELFWTDLKSPLRLIGAQQEWLKYLS